MATPIRLQDISRCFEGEVPVIMATASSTGLPNLVHLSQVLLVDDDHVAVSNQFLSKTLANLAVNPLATLLCPDPGTGATYKLLVQRVRAESDGPRFDSARVAAVPSGGADLR
jgi:adenylate cyclase